MELQTVLTPSARLSMRPLAASLASDERLARLVARGDEAACRVLYERYHQQLYRYCRSLLRDDTDAQDALQTTFISALGALGRGQRDAPMRPWLFRIAHNESISLLRRRRPMQQLSDAHEAGSVPLEEQVEERERLTELVADLHELPERQRAALVMRELSGLSHEEIALALGSSVGATKQSIFEARQSMMEFAEGRAMVCAEVRRLISDADGRVLRSRRIRAHIRDCPGCGAFAAAMPERSRQLRALAPPLPALAAAGVLTRAVGGGSAHGGDAAGLAAAGAGKTIGAAVAIKATAVAVAVTAAAGAAVALRHATPNAHPHHLAPAASSVTPGRNGTGLTTGAGGAGPRATSTRAGSAVAPSRRPPARVRARAETGNRGSAGSGAVAGTGAGTQGATSARSLTPAANAPGRTGQAPAPGSASAGHSNRRGLGPPAYPGQRSRSSSTNGSGSSHGSGTETSATHRSQGVGLTTHQPHPLPAPAATSEAAGSSGITITTGKPVLPRAPKG